MSDSKKSVLSDPKVQVALGAAALAAIGGAAYYLYNKNNSSTNPNSVAANKGKSGAASSAGPAPWPSAHHAPANVDAVSLENGHKFPTLGFGTLLSKGDTSDQMAAAVKEAIKVGYRHIDCAHVYGNEKQIGAALADVFKAGTVKRSELFVTSKLWGDSWENPRAACLTTLANLQLEYLDLYIIHWPFENTPVSEDVKSGKSPAPANIGYNAARVLHAWREMERLVRDGLVKSIGVSNFTTSKLTALLASATIKPAVNQVEMHPYLAQPKLLKFCKENGIVIAAYFVIGSARRADFLRADNDPVLLEDPVVTQIASETKASPAQVVTSWALRRGTVPIVKSLNPKRIQENWDSYTVSLTVEQAKRIDALDRDFRYIRALGFRWPLSTPWRQLWDGEHVEKGDD